MAIGIPEHIISKLGGYYRTGGYAVRVFQRSAEFGDTRRTAVSTAYADDRGIAFCLNFLP